MSIRGAWRVVAPLVIALLAAEAQALTCTLTPSASPFGFGSYTVLAAGTANLTLTYACTRTAAGDTTGTENWRIRLTTGSTSGAGGYANRTLFNGTNALLYNLYTTGAFTTIWGDTTGGTAQFTGTFNFAGVPVGGSVSTTVTGFGNIAASQDLDAGAYATTTAITATARLASGPPVVTTLNLDVNADLTANCLVDSAGDIAFGAYDPVAAGDIDVTSNLVTRCTRATNYSIALSAGGSGSFAPRAMDSAGANTGQLQYNLYTTSGYSTVWGDGTGGTATQSGAGAGILATAAVTRVIYGRLFAGQDQDADTYADVITVTVSY